MCSYSLHNDPSNLISFLLFRQIPSYFQNSISDFTQLQMTQANHKCCKKEMEALDCIEYYGMKQGLKLCADYYDDFVECVRQPIQVRS